jgi:hypothetical protein
MPRSTRRSLLKASSSLWSNAVVAGFRAGNTGCKRSIVAFHNGFGGPSGKRRKELQPREIPYEDEIADVSRDINTYG